jgi:hypothetical protein
MKMMDESSLAAMNDAAISRWCRVLPVLFMWAFIVSPLSSTARVENDLSTSGWRLWMDPQAAWKDDELFLPPVDISRLPVHEPTGGWQRLSPELGIAVDVPGTVEQYLTAYSPSNAANAGALYGALQGVSWWWRTVRPPVVPPGGRLLLRFESVRYRAEVYVNRKLVGYDLIANTPFEVDITDAVVPGGDCDVAVRLTNPGGNWDWTDFGQIHWGKYTLPMSHSFGGITGRVKLLAVDPVHVDDLYVQNTPALSEVNVILSVKNRTAQPVLRDVSVRVVEKADPAREVFQQTRKDVRFAPGETCVTVKVSVPTAKLWDPDHPNLYVCSAFLSTPTTNHQQRATDADSRVFGFRWFALDGIGSNAVLRLNGRRVMMKTAISWGFWPGNGITPTPELAERQIRVAKEMGLNMLNFHRCIGQPVVMDKADEMGLLYFEEPGGYVSGATDAFAQALAREKLLRMVKRDRSHPCMVIYNMINEQWTQFGADKDPVLQAVHEADLRTAHALDPSRLIVYASAWAQKCDADEWVKMHMRPFDDTVHFKGWWDAHRAGGPAVWLQEFYTDPNHHYGRTENAREIVYWGEEGAVSAPPRLEKIKAEVEARRDPGWDGQIYLGWYHRFADFMKQKNLMPYFPTVDTLTCAMGAVSLEHQGRKIEDTRICDLNDGYAVNGWESEPFENHSGIVDCFRNPKADAAVMAYYTQPLYIAVKVRNRVVQIPGEIVTDFYAVNEKNLQGPHTLDIRAEDSAGKTVFRSQVPVTLQGGDIYGQLLAEAVKIPVTGRTGLMRIEARLTDPVNQVKAGGHDQILAVDWKSSRLAGSGAVYEWGSRVRDFLKNQKGVTVPAFDDQQGKLDWIVVARPPLAQPKVITAECLIDAAGVPGGLTGTFYKGNDFKEKLHQRTDKQVNFTWSNGAPPDPAVPRTEHYCIRWEGQIVPPVTGSYSMVIKSDDGSRLWLDGKPLINAWRPGIARNEVTLQLEGGKPLPIRLDYFQAGQGASIHLLWSVPDPLRISPARLFERARQDGTTVIFADYSDRWMDWAKDQLPVKYDGTFQVGRDWCGGQYFVKEHPLFKGLPVNQALNWPYQQVVRDGESRYGLRLEGEELVAGCYHVVNCQLGTAVGVVPCGKGKVVISTLGICTHLGDPPGPADVARKLLCNFIEFALPSP